MESIRKEIHQKLAYIGRYMDGISPTILKYKELEQEKYKLRQELKKYPKAEFAPKAAQKTSATNKKKYVNTLSNGIYNHYYKK